MEKVLSSGAGMDLTTEVEHPTSVVPGGCVAALLQCNQGKNEKPLKVTSEENLTVQIPTATEQNNWECAPFTA